MDEQDKRDIAKALSPSTYEAIEDPDPPATRRTVWSVLSSLALHSATIASALLLITMFQSTAKVGTAEFETIAFTEDPPPEGSKNADTSSADEELNEKSEEVEREEVDVPESKVQVEQAIENEKSEVLAESEARVRESFEGVKVSGRSTDALVAKLASQQKRRSQALLKQIAAMEKNAKDRMASTKVKLKRPGAETDGSALFSVTGNAKVAFIIDISGSMGAFLPLEEGGYIRALDYVKLELAGLIRRQLSTRTKFNIITFASFANRWRSRLVTGTNPSKNSAIRFVYDLQANGGTNLYDALRLAFDDPEVRSIFLLSDGVPSVGVVDKERILKDVKRWNNGREVSINTVAFIMPAGPRDFLRQLAEENYGLAKAFP